MTPIAKIPALEQGIIIISIETGGISCSMTSGAAISASPALLLKNFELLDLVIGKVQLLVPGKANHGVYTLPESYW